MSSPSICNLLYKKIKGVNSSTTARNALSSFLALGWLSLLSMVSLPIYIRLLGTKEWGLVAACTSLQLLSFLMDAGFSQIIPRLAAKEANNQFRLHKTFILLRQIYVCLALLVFLLLQLSAHYLSHEWFQIEVNQKNELELAIRIISFQFLFQFVNNLYIGLWNGLQKQVLANIRVCIFGSLKHILTLTALMIGPSKVWVYAFTFACVAFLELIINTVSIHKMFVNKTKLINQTQAMFKPLIKEVSTLSGGVLLGLLVVQLDRILLSKMVDVENFGIYTIIVTFALAFIGLQTPVTRAYFPLLVSDISANGKISTLHFKKLLTVTIFCSTMPALVVCFFSPQILTLWLHDNNLVSVGTYPIRLLLIAVAINSVYNCIYQVIIAQGKSHLILPINFLCLVVSGIMYLLTDPSIGIVFGGVLWISIALTQLICGVIWFYKNH